MSTKIKMALVPVNFSKINMENVLIFSFKTLVVLFLITETKALTDDLNAESLKSYEELYKAGIEAYNQERWFECSEHISESMERYKGYSRALGSCRKLCHNRNVPINVEASVELNFFKIALDRSDCLRKCKWDKFGEWPEQLSPEIKAEFEKLQPYDYLQICAFKLENFGIAVAAAYTFLMKNPDHDTMRSNIEYYQSLKQVKEEQFVNLEKKLYEVYFNKIRESYAVEDYATTVTAAEDAIESYLEEFERCELMCEHSHDHAGLPHFYNAIADNWVSVLRCQSRCTGQLSWIEGEMVDDFFPELFNYLQFAYYRLNNYEKAAQTVATYLLFKPEDESMLNNRAFYMGELGVEPGAFVPVESGRQHYINQQMRLEMLQFVNKEYHFSDSDLNRMGEDLPERQTDKEMNRKGDLEEMGQNFRGLQDSNSELSSGQIVKKDEVYVKHLEDYMMEMKLTLVEEEIEDSGDTVVVDGVLTTEQCQELLKLTKMGDTDVGNRSLADTLHTLPLARAVEMASELKIPREQMQLYLTASEKSRIFLQRYFNFKKPLYNSHSQLFCQAATDEFTQDMTLPDGCLLQEGGACVNSGSSRAQYPFSAVLYFNDDFEEGEFFFAEKDLTPKGLLKAKPGKLVAYDPRMLHGVKAITKGTRCGLSMGFTFNKNMRDMAQEEGQLVLQAIDSRQKPLKNPRLRSLVEDKDYNIVMTESELNGPERFTSDKLATEKQCESLIHLANVGGVVGDGYQDAKYKKSPHTAHEEFVGLALRRASQAGGIQGDGYLPKAGQEAKISSPHTDNEVFEGLTVIRATKLLEEGGVDAEAVKLFLELSENSRELVEKYFNLNKRLYFDYTHLVCRTALDESLTEREDLSHPIHSDNCLIQGNGLCKRVRPAYIQRDYSAILYLNEDFIGGEFFFAHKNLTTQSSLKPKCGRLVAFNAANYHGVKAVLKGQRCAIAMWYTLDPTFNEAAHDIAWDVLKQLKKAQLKGPANSKHDMGEL